MNMEMGKFKPGLANESRKERVQQAMEGLGEHRVVEKLHPELLGEGDMHAVFSVEGLPKDVVAKVRRSNVYEALSIKNSGRDLKRFRTLLQAELRRERGSAKIARQYFGDYILRERIGIMDVPVTADLVTAVARDDQSPPQVAPGVHEVPALVILQDRAPEAAFGKESRGIQTFYLEERIQSIGESAPQLYEDLNHYYLDAELCDNPDFGVQLLSARENNATPSESVDLLAQIKQNDKLRDAMVDFISASMKFSRETGNIIDFIGKDNIRVYPEFEQGDEKWRIVLMDARLIGGLFVKGREAMKKMIDRQPMLDEEILCAEITINYVRYLNAWARALGMGEQLKLVNEPIAPHSGQILAYFEMLRESEDKQASNVPSQHAAAK